MSAGAGCDSPPLQACNLLTTPLASSSHRLPEWGTTQLRELATSRRRQGKARHCRHSSCFCQNRWVQPLHPQPHQGDPEARGWTPWLLFGTLTSGPPWRPAGRKVPHSRAPGTHRHPPSTHPPVTSQRSWFYLISGGVPFIICGVTAATNIRNYGTEDKDSAYCWMAWEPSLGAFYGPAAFITLVTCVYFLGTYVQLRRHPERRYELRERTEEQQQLAGPEAGPSPRAPSGVPPSCDALAACLLQNEHPFQAQLRAAAFTLFLFTATWTFGALAVSQGHFLDMVFSCLYGAFCVTLGLFVLIHHCAKRDDVWHCWWSCCPSRGDAHPALDANGDALGPATCLQDSPCPGKPRGFAHPPAGHCKMTNLQATQSHVSCLSPATPCCAKMHCEQLAEDAAHIHVHEDAFGHGPPLHSCLQGRTKPHHFGRLRAAPAEQEYAYHIPSSLDGSPHSSCTDSPTSSLEGPAGVHALACCAQGDPFPLVSQPEGGSASPTLYGCPLRLGREAAHGPAHFEMLRRTQSLPFGGPGQNGRLKDDEHDALPYGADSTGNIRTGPWRNETAV
ncbi:PREDICTED: adhesion G protein-coupled receptor A1 isoform X3 [Hipposideros armiger]|uniref:Adhesion G protein-coupled receptor A1 isoform X3 n=1 Tax=Hipposideros armiger TaxID=186990 RepID=A0A8B7REY6_HIPAR|nr:PREDICTED: adhesion G protein-coupled receptor A1 isoform X3 [Hipposideros armiger]